MFSSAEQWSRRVRQARRIAPTLSDEDARKLYAYAEECDVTAALIRLNQPPSLERRIA